MRAEAKVLPLKRFEPLHPALAHQLPLLSAQRFDRLGRQLTAEQLIKQRITDFRLGLESLRDRKRQRTQEAACIAIRTRHQTIDRIRLE